MARQTDPGQSHDEGDVYYARKARGAVETHAGGLGPVWGGQGKLPRGRDV